MLPSLAIAMLALAADPQAVVPAEPRYELTFEDGSVLVATLPDAAVNVDTKFGKVTVPLAEVKTVRIGFRYPDGMEPKVRRAVEELGSPDFKTREDAQRSLIAVGEYALPLVRAGVTSEVPEVARRCEAILAKLTTTLTDAQLDRPDVDVIHTEEMVIRGRIAAGEWKAKTKHFGELTVKAADLKGIRPLGGKSEGVFTLSAARYAAPKWKTFFDTGLEVERDQPFEIKAAGKIYQNPDQPGKQTTGPNGTAATVPGQLGWGGGVRQPVRGGIGFDREEGRPTFASGALYGRIGEHGTPFKIGEKYTQAKAPTGGRLYLVIAPSSFGGESKGEYEVKMTLGK